MMQAAVAELSCPLNSLPIRDIWKKKNTTTRCSSNNYSGPSRQVVRSVTASAAKSGGFSLNSVFKRCDTCGGQGAVECSGCKGTGNNKKNGNIFERWKCFECQGFGLKSCPECGKGGLTPEQRGER